MLVALYSDTNYVLQGFNATYTVQSCTATCDRGTCNGATCVCNPGWKGINCNEPACPNDCGSVSIHEVHLHVRRVRVVVVVVVVVGRFAGLVVSQCLTPFSFFLFFFCPVFCACGACACAHVWFLFFKRLHFSVGHCSEASNRCVCPHTHTGSDCSREVQVDTWFSPILEDAVFGRRSRFAYDVHEVRYVAVGGGNGNKQRERVCVCACGVCDVCVM